jgi:hypothetical protein
LNTRRILAAVIFVLGLMCVRAQAQVTTAPTIQAKAVHTTPPKSAKTRYEVLQMMSTAIQVRNPANEKEIRTFSYSPEIRGKMQAMLDHGGYQYGDKVVIEYMPGTEVALRIKGKPSKPS